ncbi:hypothetical protein SBA7_1560005 [Candidatus Sulfotelmatobacter sp. SbA7]|nr:hypothetical protein SBA7_1560005 [Candidatus Sulfotelmatobacter sp. SbA7]
MKFIFGMDRAVCRELHRFWALTSFLEGRAKPGKGGAEFRNGTVVLTFVPKPHPRARPTQTTVTPKLVVFSVLV